MVFQWFIAFALGYFWFGLPGVSVVLICFALPILWAVGERFFLSDKTLDKNDLFSRRER